MKIAILSTNYDLGGAAIVTRRLTDALRALGHDARMIVARPGGADSADPAVMAVDRRRWLVAFLRERLQLWLRGVKRRNLFKISTGLFGVDLHLHPFVQEADAVIIGWASQGFLSLDSMAAIIATGKPVLYMMHDLWAATCLCHMPGECRCFRQPGHFMQCKYLGNSDRLASLAAAVSNRKMELFRAGNLRLVAVSTWQRDQVESSALIMPAHPVEVVPHAFPAELFQPGEKTDAQGRRTIVMAAASLDDPIKDLPTAIDALNTFAYEYPEDARGVEVHFTGALKDPSVLSRLRLPYTHHGLVDQEELRRLYAGATVVMSSSKYETMGATLMEGMACGAIPVTFGEAGQRDVVTDAVNGFIAPAHTAASLAFALSTAMSTARAVASGDPDAPAGFSPAELHASVASRFAPETIARRILALLSPVEPTNSSKGGNF